MTRFNQALVIAALWIVAICYLSQTTAYYGEDEAGGASIYIGNWGYHFAKGEN